MPTRASMFKTPAGQAKYWAAYEASLALWPVPRESFDVPTRFGPTHMHASGPQGAPPLLLLHGLGVSSTMWHPNVAALSQAHRVYALDTIGDKGKSVCTCSLRQRSDFVAWLLEVFNALRIEQACMMGLSYGGFLALNLALTAPQRVTQLVLLAPAACLLPLVPGFYLRVLGASLFPRLQLTRSLMLQIFANPRVKASPVARQFMLTTDFRGDYKVFPRVYADHALRQVKPPTLLLLGEHEIIYNPQTALQRAQQLIPNLTAHLIPEAGHALNLDAPERVNRHLLAFLSKV